MKDLGTIQRLTLREQIIQQIRSAIIEGTLRPNDHLPIQDLTKQLGVSRAPLSEALLLLEGEGLVVSVPNKGFFVRAFEIRDVDIIFSMRTILENSAAEIVMGKLTDKDYEHIAHINTELELAIQDDSISIARSYDMLFHQFFIEKSEHDLLIKAWKQLVAQIAALLQIRADHSNTYNSDVIGDHQALVSCYENEGLETLKRLNININNRVAYECKEALRQQI